MSTDYLIKVNMQPIALMTKQAADTRRDIQVLNQFIVDTGLNRWQVVEGTRLTPADLWERDLMVDITTLYQLIGNAAQLLDNPILGLQLGDYYHLCDFGVIGYAMLCSRTLREAFQLTLRYTPLMAHRPFVTTHEIDKKRGVTRFNTVIKYPPQWDQSTQCFYDALYHSALQRVVQELTQQHTVFESLYLRSPMDQQERFQAHFRCPIYIDGETMAVDINNAILDSPLPKADPYHMAQAIRRCEEKLSELQPRIENSFIEEIHLVLLSSPGHIPTMEELAKHFHITVRTLRRRLSEQATTYRELVNDVRMKLADGYLKDNFLTVENIASLLGFSEPANFRAAFKRWTGKTPIEYRMTMEQNENTEN
jgi:AraC-like DNA-binding protein